MNEQERSELEWLKRRQERLEQELALLGKQLQVFEARINQPAPQATRAPEPSPNAGLRPSEISPEEILPVAEWARPTAMPPPIPPIIPQIMVAEMAAPPSEPVFEEMIATEEPPPPIVPIAAREKSFEMRLGTYWLVRIGIVMFLTGLV